MEAYRQIVDIKNRMLNLLLPDNFKTGKVEVIVFPVEEPVQKRKCKPSDFAGILTKEEAEKMQQYLTEARKQWDRDTY